MRVCFRGKLDRLPAEVLEDKYADCNNDLAPFLLNIFSCNSYFLFLPIFLNFLVFILLFVSFVDKNIIEQVQRTYRIVFNFLTIYTKKLLNSDWLRKECSFSVTRVQNL